MNDQSSLRAKATFNCEVIHASMPFGKSVAIGCPVVYNARTAHAFSAIIKCLHCMDVIMVIVMFLPIIVNPSNIEATFVHSKYFENYLNPVLLVFIV